MAEPLETAVVAEPAVEAELIADLVKRLVEEILARERTTLLELYLFVGQKVIHGLFGGRFEDWNERNTGSRSVLQLAELLQARDSTWTANRIYRAVRVYDQYKTFGGLDRWSHLTVSHFITVQGLAWHEQKQLLDQAEQQSMGVAALQQAVTRFRIRKEEAKAISEARPFHPETPAESQGQAPSAEAAKTLRRIERALELRDEVVADLASAGDDAAAIAELQGALEAADARVHAALARLKAAQRS